MNCRRARFLIFAVPILLALVASQALAQISFSPFQIDGIVTDANNSGVSGGYKIPPCAGPPAGTVQNPANAPNACKQLDPNSNAKELGPINGSTTKIGPINTAPKPMLGDTNPNAQVDLNAGWTQSKIVNVNGVPHVFFYFAWRRDSASGSGFLSIEIEKSRAGGLSDNCNYPLTATTAPLCNPWAGRQTGDFILLWDQNGTATNIVMAVFTGPTGEGQALNFPDCSHGGNCIDLTSQNSAAAQFGTDCGTGFVANQCGEMAIDLTAAGVFPASSAQCVTLANTIPGTVTGNSNTADYKDVILAPFPTISNCGQITVTKSTVAPDGITALNDTTSVFGYTIARNPSANVRYDLDVPNHLNDGPASQTQLIRPNCYANNGDPVSQCTNGQTVTATGQPGIKNGETQTHIDLIAGTNYTLTEQLVASTYSLLSITCTLSTQPNSPYVLVSNGSATNVTTFPVEANASTACVIVNKFVKTTPTFGSSQLVTLQDQALLRQINPGAGNRPTTVTISLWSDSACSTPATPPVNNVPTNTRQVNLTYNAAVPGGPAAGTQADSALTSPGFTVSVPSGSTTTTITYYWAFTYAGDSLNNGLGIADTCKPANVQSESVTVSLLDKTP